MTDVKVCKCGSYNLKVTDSREHGAEIWRTRTCQDCGARIYTTEICRTDIGRADRALEAIKKIKEGMDILNALE